MSRYLDKITGSRSTMSVVACLMTSLLAVVSGSAVDAESVTYFVTEELPVGSVVGNLVTDFALKRLYNLSPLSGISFEFLTQTAGEEYLKLENGSWNIVVAGRIDRELLCADDRHCVLYYTVAVRPLHVFRLLGIEIEVLDVNDHRPTFSGVLAPRHVTENAEVGSLLAVATVRDRDVGVNGLDRYEVTTDCDGFDPRPIRRRLASGEVELQLRVVSRLDRETQSRCSVVIWAVDGGSPARTGSTQVDIIVDDINDNAPSFDADSYEVWIPEDLAVGTCFVKVSASDSDDGLNAMLTYSLDVADWDGTHLSAGASIPFQIDAESGTICLKEELDFERQSVYLLPLLAHDRGVESLSGRSMLAVYVEDVNDHAPAIIIEVISGSATDVEVEENSDEGGLTLALVTVIDLDSGRNGRVVCGLNETSKFQLVEMYRGQFHIVTVSALDREERDRYSLIIHCRDLGVPSLSSSAVVSVRVIDQNDHAPQFSQDVYTASIVENAPRGQPLLRAVAVDLDDGLNAEVTYSLQDDPDGLLDIDPASGVVSSARELDFETSQLVVAKVVAVDGGVPPRSSSAAVILRVVNVDDERLAFSQPRYEFRITENQLAGTLVGHVTAHDLDIPATERRVRYRLEATEDSQMFQVVEETGAILTNASLDFESRRQYRLLVSAVELSHPGFTAVCDVTVTVDDVNDHRPRFVFPSPGGGDHVTVEVERGRPVDQVVCTLIADDHDGERLTFKLVSDHSSDPVKFYLDPDTGELRLTAEHLEVGYVELTVVVQVEDHGVPPLHDSAYLRVIVQSSTSSWQGQTRVRSRSPRQTRGRPGAVAAVAVAVACCAVVLVLLSVLLVVVVRRRTYDNKNADFYQTYQTVT